MNIHHIVIINLTQILLCIFFTVIPLESKRHEKDRLLFFMYKPSLNLPVSESLGASSSRVSWRRVSKGGLSYSIYLKLWDLPCGGSGAGPLGGGGIRFLQGKWIVNFYQNYVSKVQYSSFLFVNKVFMQVNSMTKFSQETWSLTRIKIYISRI